MMYSTQFKKRIQYLFIISIFFSLCSSIKASDWPQYLGPDRNSTSPEKGILRSWPESGPEVLWNVSVGKDIRPNMARISDDCLASSSRRMARRVTRRSELDQGNVQRFDAATLKRF